MNQSTYITRFAEGLPTLQCTSAKRVAGADVADGKGRQVRRVHQVRRVCMVMLDHQGQQEYQGQQGQRGQQELPRKFSNIKALELCYSSWPCSSFRPLVVDGGNGAGSSRPLMQSQESVHQSWI